MPAAIVRYYGETIVGVLRAAPGAPWGLYATFFGPTGNETLRLKGSSWEGSLDNWDIEVSGPRITVRRARGEIVLCLRLNPPGNIIIERLDMRIGDAHVLATDKAHAIGRYVDDGSIAWVSAKLTMTGGNPDAVVIDLSSAEEMLGRVQTAGSRGPHMASAHGRFVVGAHAGVMCPPMGVALGAGSGALRLYGAALGRRAIGDVRRVLIRHPDRLPRFIATGQLG